MTGTIPIFTLKKESKAMRKFNFIKNGRTWIAQEMRTDPQGKETCVNWIKAGSRRNCLKIIKGLQDKDLSFQVTWGGWDNLSTYLEYNFQTFDEFMTVFNRNKPRFQDGINGWYIQSH